MTGALMSLLGECHMACPQGHIAPGGKGKMLLDAGVCHSKVKQFLAPWTCSGGSDGRNCGLDEMAMFPVRSQVVLVSMPAENK